MITTVAGNGGFTFSGDGGPATAAALNHPGGVAVDTNGNVFIADAYNCRVRRVDTATGIITTVAGNGQFSFSGDEGPATAAALWFPIGVRVDDGGNLFITDLYNHRVRRVDASTGIITTFAGNGESGFSGDGGLATNAGMAPAGVAIDSSGNLVIADANSRRIRRIDASTGKITTVAGGGNPADGLGDGGLATQATFSGSGLTADAHGNIFITDWGNFRVRRVDATTGIITTVAGSGGRGGNSGDGGPATLATM